MVVVIALLETDSPGKPRKFGVAHVGWRLTWAFGTVTQLYLRHGRMHDHSGTSRLTADTQEQCSPKGRLLSIIVSPFVSHISVHKIKMKTNPRYQQRRSTS